MLALSESPPASRLRGLKKRRIFRCFVAAIGPCVPSATARIRRQFVRAPRHFGDRQPGASQRRRVRPPRCISSPPLGEEPQRRRRRKGPVARVSRKMNPKTRAGLALKTISRRFHFVCSANFWAGPFLLRIRQFRNVSTSFPLRVRPTPLSCPFLGEGLFASCVAALDFYSFCFFHCALSGAGTLFGTHHSAGRIAVPAFHDGHLFYATFRFLSLREPHFSADFLDVLVKDFLVSIS